MSKVNPEWDRDFVFALMGSASHPDDAESVVYRAAAIADAAAALRKERRKGEEPGRANDGTTVGLDASPL